MGIVSVGHAVFAATLVALAAGVDTHHRDWETQRL
jgi:hypothetical protein